MLNGDNSNMIEKSSIIFQTESIIERDGKMSCIWGCLASIYDTKSMATKVLVLRQKMLNNIWRRRTIIDPRICSIMASPLGKFCKIAMKDNSKSLL